MRQGGARNTGIKHAKGDYILFIDSDDYLSGTNILSELDAVISKRECSFVRSSSIHRVAFDSMPILRDEIRNPKIEYLDSETYILSPDFCCEIVKGCYNRRFLCDNELYFREHVAYEDTDWMFKVCAKAETIALIDFPFYCYRHNPSSVTNRPSTASMINNIQALGVLYDILENGKQEYSYDVKRKMYRRIGNSMKGLLTKSYRYEIKDAQKIISSIPDKLYNVSAEFQAGTKILFFFENHCSLPIIIALRMAYRLKCIIKGSWTSITTYHQ